MMRLSQDSQGSEEAGGGRYHKKPWETW